MRVVQALLTFLVNASWQILLVVAFAALCDRLLRDVPVRYRHWLWVASLTLCLAVPIFTCFRANKGASSLASSTSQLTSDSTAIVITRIITPGVEDIQRSIANDTPSTSHDAGRLTQSDRIHINRYLALSVIMLYTLFVLWRTMKLARAWRRTRTILKSANPSALPLKFQLIIDQCSRLIGARCGRILHSKDVSVPITLGFFNPIIILPSNLLAEENSELLTSAIGHELVHVVRNDYLLNLLFEFMCLPLSFHPAIGLVRRRLRQTRELCCDQMVAARLLKPEIYARSLMRLIGSAPISRGLLSDTTIGLNESDILEVRIMSLLKSSKLVSRRRRFLLISLSLFLMTPCVLAASLAVKLDLDQQQPTASAIAKEKQQQELLQQQKQEMHELRRQAEVLKENLQAVPAAKRAEIEARLREVQQNLDQHERALQEVRQQKESLEKFRESVEQYANNRSADPAQLKRLEEELAKLETTFPADEAKMREAKEKLAQVEKAGQADRKAKLIYRVEPEYPADARENKIEGTVLLAMTIDHDGVPQNIRIEKSLYPSLDKAAIEAVSKWRFEPAMKDGQPVSMIVKVEMYFSANDKREQDKGQAADEYRLTGELRMKRSKEREDQAQDERARRQAELTRDAIVPMDRAIQIATSQVPGKVLACSLGRDAGTVFYHVVIVTTEGDETTATYVWVSAIDGHVIKTEKEKKEETSRGGFISGGVLNNKALNLPNPQYPDAARAAKASGSVKVQIVVDEQGNVINAKAISGHPLLLDASVAAARGAKFTPTSLEGKPVKVTGVIVYNFVAQ